MQSISNLTQNHSINSLGIIFLQNSSLLTLAIVQKYLINPYLERKHCPHCPPKFSNSFKIISFFGLTLTERLLNRKLGVLAAQVMLISVACVTLLLKKRAAKLPLDLEVEPEQLHTLFDIKNLRLSYEKGPNFDSATINGEKFALIVNRSLENFAHDKVLNYPDHHLITLDPIFAVNLTLKGKSVTILNKVETVENVVLEAERTKGNVIVYGGGNVVNAGNDAITFGKELIIRGIRIVTIRENGNQKIVNHFAVAKALFQEGVNNNCSATIALAILKVGHEILLSREGITQSQILSLWNVPTHEF